MNAHLTMSSTINLTICLTWNMKTRTSAKNAGEHAGCCPGDNTVSGRVLHVLSQRPSLTGSGVTLDAIVRHAAATGWDQRVVVGVPPEDPQPSIGDLSANSIAPLIFEQEELDFPLPGMSDVMPYRSSVFSSLTPTQLSAYREVWRRHLAAVAAEFHPQLVHTHHVWIVSSLIKDILPEVPVVNHCHATGLRQMSLCPHLTGEVRRGARRNDRFLVMSRDHAVQLSSCLDLSADRIQVVGAGYREDLFHTSAADLRAITGPEGEEPAERIGHLLFIGKYSAAKGLPWLLDAFTRLQVRRPELRLHVAGSGAGPEAAALEHRMRAMAPTLVLHGQLTQQELAELMRRCAVCVLPSFYEGVPLVLIEALACGCRLVTTRLSGIKEQLAPTLGPFLDLIPLPRLHTIDSPVAEDLPAFVHDLETAMETALAKPSPLHHAGRLQKALIPYTWSAVFQRVATVWRDLTQ